MCWKVCKFLAWFSNKYKLYIFILWFHTRFVWFVSQNWWRCTFFYSNLSNKIFKSLSTHSMHSICFFESDPKAAPSRSQGNNLWDQIFRFRWFLGAYHEYELHYPPSLTKIWGLGVRVFLWDVPFKDLVHSALDIKCNRTCSTKSMYLHMTHCQMFQKVESVLPAKIGRLVGCTKMISW